jgi:hypothetical protein
MMRFRGIGLGRKLEHRMHVRKMARNPYGGPHWLPMFAYEMRRRYLLL